MAASGAEAIFARLKGVKSVLPGYSGGSVENPSHDDVCTGSTGHAEAAQIEFDRTVISFEKLLDVFWHTQQWDGVLPLVTGGSGATPFIEIPSGDSVQAAGTNSSGNSTSTGNATQGP